MNARRLGGLIVIVLVTACEPSATLGFANGFIREPIGGRDVTAAYCDITNRTGTSVVITGAHAPWARAIEFHESVTIGATTRMVHHAEIELPPGATVRLVPGGKHLMLFGVANPSDRVGEPFGGQLGIGTTRHIEFVTKGHGTVRVPFKVGSLSEGGR